MSRNSVRITATRDAVFDALEDAYRYPRWVVGTRRVRRVDPEWPAVGSRFHHAVGTAAGELHDSTLMLERRRPEHVTLEVRFRPTGVACVAIDLAADGPECVVTLTEEPSAGPITWLPRFVVEPLLALRNAISLQRFRHEVERETVSP